MLQIAALDGTAPDFRAGRALLANGSHMWGEARGAACKPHGARARLRVQKTQMNEGLPPSNINCSEDCQGFRINIITKGWK